jgi:molybdate/tungstate transport system substrate-binding protein
VIDARPVGVFQALAGRATFSYMTFDKMATVALALALASAVARGQTVAVGGAVAQPYTLTDSVAATLPPRQAAGYDGVALRDVVARARPTSGTSVSGVAADGYRVVFTMAEVDTASVLVATRKDGQPLPEREGHFRLIVPGDPRPVRWLKQLTTITVASGTAPGDTLVVFDAGTLAIPLKTAFDSFAVGHPAVLQQENAGSLETARKLIDLGKTPDVIALADYDIFPRLLMPRFTQWYAIFARNRMVVAYTPKSRGASEITPSNWWQVITKPGVEVGRSDPNLDPAGYRALLLFQLAEIEYHHPGLAAALERSASARDVRAKSADLVALVQAGELDYALVYESTAQDAHLSYLALPDRINLGEPADSAFYARASVRVVGATPKDTIEVRGAPIRYALSIPSGAPHLAVARQFVEYLLSPAGVRVMRSRHLDALDQAVRVGAGAPP